MDTKGLQKEFLSWCKSKNKSPKTEDETKLLFVAFMKEKHPEEYKQAILNQLKQLQAQAQKAAHGAKLNYFKSLKNQCAEDEEVIYYKKGGSVGCGCKKKMEEGGQTPKKKNNAIDRFKNRKQDLATKDSIAVNNYGAEDIEATRPGTYKKNKEGKVQWTPDRTKAPYNKKAEKKACGSKLMKKEEGGAVARFKAAKCGSKLKKHLLGGSLNGIPFMLKGTPKKGIKTRYDDLSAWDFVPFVGSYRDIMRAYDYPSTGNIINAGLSTAGDVLGLGAFGAVAKAASKYNKISKALKAKGFFRPTGAGRLWIKVGTKETPINAGKFGTIGTKTEPAVYTKTVPEVDLTAPVMWGFSAVPARTIKNSLYEPNQ